MLGLLGWLSYVAILCSSHAVLADLKGRKWFVKGAVTYRIGDGEKDGVRRRGS
jgi:hypothetical protein